MPLPDTWNAFPIEFKNACYISPYYILINLSLLITFRIMNKAIMGSTALSPEDINITMTDVAAILAPSDAVFAVSPVV